MSGLGHWKWQRVSSVLLIPFTAWLLWSVTSLAGAGLDEARAFFGNPLNAMVAVAMTALVAYHAQTGIQVICEDYIVKPWQDLLIWVTRIACLLGTVAVAWIMWQLNGGVTS